MERLRQQLEFLAEIDKLKKIERQTLLLDTSRRENDAEHSWHLAMLAIVLAEYSNRPVDLTRVVKMVLVHDLVEIDAGDSYAYDPEAQLDKHERELAAAERIFAILPDDQAAELRQLWDEFEEGASADAQFASALDRFQPLLHNLLTEGKSWRENEVSRSAVWRRCSPIENGSKVLWQHMAERIEQAVRDGLLRDA
ncbi:MAG: HD domain-containing protein [Candidatus Eremiobacteraeota bacterium]|nr:HD domain-containing protein [Candidatus Eremiobacteraeota bacterium]